MGNCNHWIKKKYFLLRQWIIIIKIWKFRIKLKINKFRIIKKGFIQKNSNKDEIINESEKKLENKDQIIDELEKKLNNIIKINYNK